MTTVDKLTSNLTTLIGGAEKSAVDHNLAQPDFDISVVVFATFEPGTYPLTRPTDSNYKTTYGSEKIVPMHAWECTTPDCRNYELLVGSPNDHEKFMLAKEFVAKTQGEAVTKAEAWLVAVIKTSKYYSSATKIAIIMQGVRTPD